VTTNPIGTQDLHFPLIPEILQQPIPTRMVIQRNFETVEDTFKNLNRYLLGDPVHFKSVIVDQDLHVTRDLYVGRNTVISGVLDVAGGSTLHAQLRVAADNNYFGIGAVGAAGTYANVGSLGDPNNAYVTANSSGANAGLVFRSKGTAGIYLQNVDGSVIMAYADPTTRAFYASSLYGSKLNDKRRDAQAFMSGFGFGYSADGATFGTSYGDPSAGLAIAVGRGDPAVVFKQKGSGDILQLVDDTQLKAYFTGQGQEVCDILYNSIYLGSYGGTRGGSRLKIDTGDPNVVYMNAESSGAVCHFFHNTVGTGAVHRFYVEGQYMLDIRGPSTLTPNVTGLVIWNKDAAGGNQWNVVQAIGGVAGVPGRVLWI